MKKIIGNIVFFLFPFLLILYYYRYYSAVDTWGIQCTFHHLTGYLCPGCGGQRAIHALLHGNIIEAFHDNVLIILILPLLVFYYIVLGQGYLLSNKKFENYGNFKTVYLYVFIAVLVLFFILRNIPYYPFTLLAP